MWKIKWQISFFLPNQLIMNKNDMALPVLFIMYSTNKLYIYLFISALATNYLCVVSRVCVCVPALRCALLCDTNNSDLLSNHTDTV